MKNETLYSLFSLGHIVSFERKEKIDGSDYIYGAVATKIISEGGTPGESFRTLPPIYASGTSLDEASDYLYALVMERWEKDQVVKEKNKNRLLDGWKGIEF